MRNEHRPTEGAPEFNGPDYVPPRDKGRLSAQIERIFDLMRDGQWRTLDGIFQLTGDPPASISAQLRHLRKARFGGHTVEKRYVGGGLYEYRVAVRDLQPSDNAVSLCPDEPESRQVKA